MISPLKKILCRIKPYSNMLIGLLVVASAVALRLSVITGLPFTDEGFYAWLSMMTHRSLAAGEGLPPINVLALYPTLLSFVFSWSINHIIALRLCDLLVAALVAWQLFRLTSQESGNALVGGLIAFIFTVALNLPIFINSGFKNAAFAAWLFLLPALRLGLRAEREEARTFFLCGLLACIGFFCRESTAPLSLVGFIAILAARGRRCALSYAAGGGLMAVAIIALFAYARGGLGNIIEAYAQFYSMQMKLIAPAVNTFKNFKITAKEIIFLAPAAAAILIAGALGAAAKDLRKARIFFWLAVSLAPLTEILFKGGYPYHFSFAFYGLSGLAAYTGRSWQTPRPWLRPSLLFIGLLWGVSLILGLGLLAQARGPARRAIPAITRMLPEQTWPAEMLNTSNYLMMADAIIRNSSPDDTLEVSGCYYLLYALTLRFPPPDKTNHLFDLGFHAIANDLSAEDMRRYLENNQTNIVVLSGRSGLDVEVVKNALEGMPQYHMREYVGWSAERHYGGFTGAIYVRRP